MKSWTIGRRIIAGFTGVILVSMIVGAVNFAKLRTIQSDTDFITRDCLPGTALIGRIGHGILENQALVLEHILSEDKSRVEKIEHELKERTAGIGKMLGEYEHTITSPRDRELFEALKVARDKVVDVRDTVVLPLSRELKNKEAAAAFETKLEPLYKSFGSATEALMLFNAENSDRAGTSIRNSVRTGERATVFGILLSLVAGSIVAFSVIRSTGKLLFKISAHLNESSDQVASASMQVSSSSQTLAEGASEQAASLEETSASLEEMASMTRRNAENAQSAKELANQARLAADTGASDMAQMDGAMAEIKQASDNIAKIIKTIDEIAFQTNILALNAAVEAARAGEAGMGFAVVADEVRSLAQRSAQAAKETAEKIEDCIRKSEAGVEISTKVAGSLQEILSKATQVDELVAEIATASREQSQGIDQVNTALTQMDKVTQSNAASAEESASAAEELSGQAQALKDAVGDLEKLVGGGGAKAGKMPDPISVPVNAPSFKQNHGPRGAKGERRVVRANGAARSTYRNGSPISLQSRDTIPLEAEFNDF